MSSKHISYANREFVFKWADRWRHLSDMILDLMHTGNPWIPSSPDEQDEIRYCDLRSWLIDHEAIFLPLWKDYYMSMDWTLDTTNDLITEIREAEKDLENPFLWFYGSTDLNAFYREYVVDKNSGQPNEKCARTITKNLLLVNMLAVDFVNWICDMGEAGELMRNEQD